MSRIFSVVDWLGALYRRTGLTVRGLLALAVAAGTIAGAALVLAVTSEDVLGHDGMATDDPHWLRFVTDHRSGWLIKVAHGLSDLGAVGVLGVLAVVAAVILWLRGARLALAIAPALALGLAGAFAAVGKQVVGRSRPPVGFRLAVETEASFPSGHTTDSTAFFVALALVMAVVVLRSPRVRVLIVAAAAMLAGSIGASRLELGVHWPTDVIAGYMIGLIVAVSVTSAAVLVNHFSAPAAPDGSRRWLRRVMAVLSFERHPTTLKASASS
jgi:undecaprenyl-diphosphatase